MDIKETKELQDTDPDLYVGYPEVDPITGELSTGKKKKKGKNGEDVNDEDLHADPATGVPDEKKPTIAPPLPENIVNIKVVDEKNVTVLKETVTLPFLKQAYKQAQQPGYKMMWETDKEAGDMTPALFVKLYSKAISLKETREERVDIMSEKKIDESKQNEFYKNELMGIGILKQTPPKQHDSLNEVNPVRKALEIYYNSPNTVDKPAKEDSLVETKAEPKVEEKKETPKKKRFPIIW